MSGHITPDHHWRDIGRRRRRGCAARWWALCAALGLALVTGCSGAAGPAPADRVLTITAIPDQDPEKLQRLYGQVGSYLTERLGVTVRYQPVTDYTASVTSFRRGDVDLAFFGGLTGVQARQQVPGAVALAQRDVDERFRSVFVAGTDAGLTPFTEVSGLTEVAGKTVTFGSEVSTSGRLMPQFFLDQAGVAPDGLRGPPGFSGSHDATIKLVTAGTYQVGALSASVWDARLAEGAVDVGKVVEIFRTPTYHDYHWLGRPDLDQKFGAGFTEKVRATLLGLDGSDQRERDILALFTAGAFVSTEPGNYDDIESIARKLDLLQ
jgi:phosphonate transport system substrate-binding protein